MNGWYLFGNRETKITQLAEKILANITPWINIISMEVSTWEMPTPEIQIIQSSDSTTTGFSKLKYKPNW